MTAGKTLPPEKPLRRFIPGRKISIKLTLYSKPIPRYAITFARLLAGKNLAKVAFLTSNVE
jgi:hypothetical protein